MPDPFRPTVLVTSHYDRAVVAAPMQRLAGWAQVVDARRGRCLTRAELLECLPGAHAVIASDESYTAEILGAAQDLFMIARDGTGYDAIDLNAATECGILVTRAPVLHHATANTTIGLMIALVRKISLADRGIRENRWNDRSLWLAPDLTGMTLGIVGFGQVGTEVAKRATAMGMSILIYNRSDVSAAAGKIGAKSVAMDDLLANSHVVSLHTRHTDTTAGMCNADFFAKMKKGTYFVNTARGGLVDEGALCEALSCGHLAGAALDVFAREPAEPDNPLLAFNNVLCTPHFAGDTTTTMARAVESAVRQIADCFAGKKPQHLINPQAWDNARIHNLEAST